MRKPIGVILYRGPSLIDGSPIALVATFRSRNSKTGDMIQTWIISDVVSPITAILTGQDIAVCGDCPLRGQLVDGKLRNRSCYVNVAQAPQQVFRSLQAGRYPVYDRKQHADLFRGRAMRLGAYGDPTAVPIRAWRQVLPLVDGHTGYTHQWRHCRPAWRSYVMASVESPADAAEAQRKGWRTFRIKRDGQPYLATEIMCPASAEAGHRLECASCLACSGGSSSRRSVAIDGHGSPPVLYSLERIVG